MDYLYLHLQYRWTAGWQKFMADTNFKRYLNTLAFPLHNAGLVKRKVLWACHTMTCKPACKKYFEHAQKFSVSKQNAIDTFAHVSHTFVYATHTFVHVIHTFVHARKSLNSCSDCLVIRRYPHAGSRVIV